MAKFNKRIYGIAGIGAYMSNWNADFTGRPKTTSTGIVFGSDKALKYSIKRYWVNQGDKVLYYKSYIVQDKGGDKAKLQPKDLTERYQEVFQTELTDKTPSKEVLKNLFSAVDVMNFGATFAVKKQNIGLTGAVQIGQGLNKYEDTNVEIQDILSPFRNANKSDADASSLGKKIVSNEAHYVYPFSVNYNHYDEYISLLDGFEGYTIEAYEKLKEGLLRGATALNTNSKAGCENELALFVTCREGSELFLPQLDSYVEVWKEGSQIIYNLVALEQFLSQFGDDIELIEVFYNPVRIAVKKETNLFAEKNIYTFEQL
nr:type I CRISPR-associated protein Cas7 [Heyndrickxia coagulans]